MKLLDHRVSQRDEGSGDASFLPTLLLPWVRALHGLLNVQAEKGLRLFKGAMVELRWIPLPPALGDSVLLFVLDSVPRLLNSSVSLEVSSNPLCLVLTLSPRCFNGPATCDFLCSTI